MAVQHRYISNTALPYISNTNVVTDGVYFRTGSNVMTSVSQYAERRPGFPVYTANTGLADIKRFFTWRRWGADWYAMMGTVTSSTTTGNSLVYKQRVGTDATFSSIYTSSTATAFDFAVSNNSTFFGNGVDMQKYDGTTVSNWGIGTPASAITSSLVTSGSLTATIGYLYVVCFSSSTSTHVGSPSPFLSTRIVPDAQNINVSGNTTIDPQVTQVRVFRTTDGGSVYFEHPSSPVVYSTWVSSGLTDSSADTALLSTEAPLAGFNNRPPQSKSCAFYAGRIWTTSSSSVNFSGFEEINIGVKEEAFPEFNNFSFGAETTGIGVTENSLLVFTAHTVFRITGDSLDTFHRETAFSNAGTHNNATVTSNGKVVAWLDSTNIIRVSDGFSMEEVSIPIRPDLQNINHDLAQMTFYDNGVYQWLILLDGGNDKMYAHNLDTGHWNVPWDLTDITAISHGETSAGAAQLFVGRNGKPLALSTTAYTDESATYPASITTNAFNVLSDSDPDADAAVDTLVIERDSHVIDSVGLLTDEDPGTGSPTFTTLTSSTNPTNRTQGTNLVEKHFHTEYGPVSRRISTQISWTGSAQNFKWYSIDVVSQVMGDTDA
jgi:hypothetical protein